MSHERKKILQHQDASPDLLKPMEISPPAANDSVTDEKKPEVSPKSTDAGIMKRLSAMIIKKNEDETLTPHQQSLIELKTLGSLLKKAEKLVASIDKLLEKQKEHMTPEEIQKLKTLRETLAESLEQKNVTMEKPPLINQLKQAAHLDTLNPVAQLKIYKNITDNTTANVMGVKKMKDGIIENAEKRAVTELPEIRSQLESIKSSIRERKAASAAPADSKEEQESSQTLTKKSLSH